jgi:hypothetical protein
MEPTETPEDRNAAVLRRTLSAVSWLYGLWSALIALTVRAHPSEALVDWRLILLHASLLGLAGAMQWRPRRAALSCTILAAVGSIFFVIHDLERGGVGAAIVDGAYVPMAAALLYKTRRSA